MTAPSLPLAVPELTHLAQIIQLAVAPVFLLAGLGAFLNVCAGRLARIVDRARALEPRILASRGSEHDRLIGEMRLLDRRMRIVSRAIFLSVLAALLISAVVVLLFAAFLTGYRFGTADRLAVHRRDDLHRARASPSSSTKPASARARARPQPTFSSIRPTPTRRISRLPGDSRLDKGAGI